MRDEVRRVTSRVYGRLHQPTPHPCISFAQTYTSGIKFLEARATLKDYSFDNYSPS
jgi:hypothetical protein